MGMDVAQRRLPLLGLALAVLALPAASLRAALSAPAPVVLSCTDEPESDTVLPALASEPVAATAAAPPPSKRSKSAPPSKGSKSRHKRPAAVSLCQKSNWLQEAASCKFREGPEEFLQQFGGFWNNTKNTCPLTQQSLAKAIRPYGHEGARLRLRKAMSRLRRGYNISIAVLGPSSTWGAKTRRAWPARLQDLFDRLGLRVNVTNLARSGTTSQWVVASFNEIKDPLMHADIIMVDYGINDRQNTFRKSATIKAVYHDLVKLLVALPKRPGIVDVQTFMDTPLLLDREEARVPTHDCSAVDLRSYYHWPVNKELHVPMLSYTEAVCDSQRTWWMAEDKSQDSPGTPHPGAITHDLTARVALGFLLDELDYVCQHGVAGRDFDGRHEFRMGGSVECLTQPTTVLSSSAGFEASYHDSRSWFFGTDLPGKPEGWIARAGVAPRGELQFEIVTQAGWIQVEYLGTYQNVGAVDLWLDDREPSQQNRCRVSGAWEDHSSQSKFSLVTTNASPGRHTLRIRSRSEKFKLLSVTAC